MHNQHRFAEKGHWDGWKSCTGVTDGGLKHLEIYKECPDDVTTIIYSIPSWADDTAEDISQTIFSDQF